MSREIEGIPYFGENSIEIENYIKNKSIDKDICYDSLYELIEYEKDAQNVIVIEDSSGKQLTYIRDIRFNYRDKEVFIPYYRYSLQKIDKGNTDILTFDIK